MTIRNLLGRCIRNILAPVHLKSSLAQYRALQRQHPDAPEGWIAITESYVGKGWFADMKSWQVPSEFLQMQQRVLAAKPAVILEIGTAKGATLLGWCRIAAKKVISVDLLGGIHGGGYPSIKQGLYKEFVSDRPGVELHLIQADSHLPTTREEAKKRLFGDAIDVLFIDGDHSYEGVKADFELWSTLVSPGGLVIFHDILPHKVVAHCEVDKLWNELKPRYAHEEYIDNPDQGWAGIGVLTMP
jgi:cephalosporin hydroxylase